MLTLVQRLCAGKPAAVLAALAIALVGASSASAAGPPITPLSPAPGATIVRASTTQPLVVEFTCPVFESSYGSIIDSYWASLSTSPATKLDGSLSNQIDFTQAVPVGPGRCAAELSTSPNGYLAGTYYWQAERINCDAISCVETSPVTSVVLADPPPPAPVPKPGGAGSVTAYIACGLTRNARRASVCPTGSKVGAFFKASGPTSYSICVRYPGGKSLCAKTQKAEGGVLYVNKITSNRVGRYKVTWTFEGRRVVRFYRKS